MIDLCMTNKDKHGKIDCNLLRRPIPFITLFIFSGICSLNDNLLSRFSPRCFWAEARLTPNLLKESSGWVADLGFLDLLRLFIFVRVEWHFLLVCPILYGHQVKNIHTITPKNAEVSSAKCLTLDNSPCFKPLI